MAKLTKIGDWHVTSRTDDHEVWECDEGAASTINLDRDRTRPAGQTWRWQRGRKSGLERTRPDALSVAMRAYPPPVRPDNPDAFALTPAKRRASGPSGQHVRPRRFLGLSPEEWELVDRATAGGEAWTGWAREALIAAAKRRLRKK